MNQEPSMPAIEDEGLYESAVAARFCGVSPATMRNSRWSGNLVGIVPPAHMKMGTKVLYRGKTLKDWRGQFKEHVTTREHAN